MALFDKFKKAATEAGATLYDKAKQIVSAAGPGRDATRTCTRSGHGARLRSEAERSSNAQSLFPVHHRHAERRPVDRP
jgi:hypothetical protein